MYVRLTAETHLPLCYINWVLIMRNSGEYSVKWILILFF